MSTAPTFSGSIAEALRRLSLVVSDRTGLVAEVVTPEREHGDPRVHIALARPAAALPGWSAGVVNEGAGAALTLERAMVKALAESMERYCAAFTPADLVFASADEIDSAIPPEAFLSSATGNMPQRVSRSLGRIAAAGTNGLRVRSSQIAASAMLRPRSSTYHSPVGPTSRE